MEGVSKAVIEDTTCPVITSTHDSLRVQGYRKQSILNPWGLLIQLDTFQARIWANGRSIDLYFCTRPQAQKKNENSVTHAQQSNQRRQKESDASRLPLLQTAGSGGNALGFVHLGNITGGLERVAGGGQRLEVGFVLFLGLRLIH